VLEQWNIEPMTRRCVVTGAELKDGQDFYSVLFADGEGFRREDYSLEAWSGPPEGAFCHFRARVPVRRKKQQLLVDSDTLVNFFVRLGDVVDPPKLRFRFVLALILMRKRLLEYLETFRREGQEFWRMRLTREPTQGGASVDDVHIVLNPHLNDEQIEAVSKELSTILHGSGGGNGDAGGA